LTPFKILGYTKRISTILSAFGSIDKPETLFGKARRQAGFDKKAFDAINISKGGPV
jgi:hypothetical protein